MTQACTSWEAPPLEVVAAAAAELGAEALVAEAHAQGAQAVSERLRRLDELRRTAESLPLSDGSAAAPLPAGSA